MGRNFHCICDKCQEYSFLFRGKESAPMHRWADIHYAHKESVRYIDDYAEEPPVEYEDVSDMLLRDGDE